MFLVITVPSLVFVPRSALQQEGNPHVQWNLFIRLRKGQASQGWPCHAFTLLVVLISSSGYSSNPHIPLKPGGHMLAGKVFSNLPVCI